MDFHLETKYQELVKELEKELGGGIDLQAIIFMVGVQELGKGYQKFKKDDKVNLMHIAICTLLSQYGYYTFEGRDEEGWPHFKLEKELPKLNDRQQEHLIKEALLEYFSDILPNVSGKA